MDIKNYTNSLAQLSHLGRNEPVKFDIMTTLRIDNFGERQLYSTVTSVNQLGYIPGISTITGSARIAVNLLKIVGNLALTILLQQNPITTTKNIGTSMIKIVRGAIEMVPFAGNLLCLTIDQIRIKFIERKINNNTVDKENFQASYINGKHIIRGVYVQDSNLQYAVGTMVQAGFRFRGQGL